MRVFAMFVSLALVSAFAFAADPRTSSVPSSTWVQEAALTGSDAVDFSLAGYSVAIDGNTVVAGNFSGQEAYVFTKSSSGWHSMTQVATLRPSTSAALNFGHCVAISGNTIVVGAAQETIGSNSLQGAVYVFVKPASGWSDMTETAKLTASDGGFDDLLGTSVAIIGNTIVAGATFHKPNGAAYVFVRPASGWATGTQTAELTASSSASASEVGALVAISGSTIAAGAGLSTSFDVQGGALVFVKPSTGWTNMTETAVLGTGQIDGTAVNSLAMISGMVVAGSPNVTANGVQHSGSAFVWVKPAAGWHNSAPTAELTASDGNAGARFGISVSTNGSTIVVGAANQNVGSNPSQGQAYVFNQPAGGWTSMTETARISRGGGRPAELFGWAVGISGGTIVSSAPWANQNTGAAYIFGQ